MEKLFNATVLHSITTEQLFSSEQLPSSQEQETKNGTPKFFGKNGSGNKVQPVLGTGFGTFLSPSICKEQDSRGQHCIWKSHLSFLCFNQPWPRSVFEATANRTHWKRVLRLWLRVFRGGCCHVLQGCFDCIQCIQAIIPFFSFCRITRTAS